MFFGGCFRFVLVFFGGCIRFRLVFYSPKANPQSAATPPFHSTIAVIRNQVRNETGNLFLLKLVLALLAQGVSESRSVSSRFSLMVRPNCLSAAEVRRVRRYVLRHRQRKAGITAVAILRALRLPCSARTIQRCLRRMGFRSVVRLQKSAVSLGDANRRLRWARHPPAPPDAYADCKFFPMPLKEKHHRSEKVWILRGERLARWACRDTKGFKAPGVHIFAAIGYRRGRGIKVFAAAYKRFTAAAASVLVTRLAPT